MFETKRYVWSGDPRDADENRTVNPDADHKRLSLHTTDKADPQHLFLGAWVRFFVFSGLLGKLVSAINLCLCINSQVL